jgi:2-iminobutanoate/2-iminopropanoate deaminase
MEIVSSSQAPQPKVPLSQAAKSGNLVFVSGIAPFTLTLELSVGDLDKQMKQTMENVGAILRAAGTDFDRVLKTTVILATR